jgi:hypothetical protein
MVSSAWSLTAIAVVTAAKVIHELIALLRQHRRQGSLERLACQAVPGTRITDYGADGTATEITVGYPTSPAWASSPIDLGRGPR